MQLQLDDVALFVRIVELGTLSAAARERDTPVSQVTRALARLEAACSVRLLHRSTHGLSLTDEGGTFLVHARKLLETAADLHSDLSGRTGGPAGWVRLSVSAVLAQAVIAPSLPSLNERYPRLQLDIVADDRIVDMAREGIDIAIRAGASPGEQLVARQIGVLTRSLYAAPAYVARYGLPRHPDDLQRHRLIANTANPSLNRWAWHEPRPAARRGSFPLGGTGPKAQGCTSEPARPPEGRIPEGAARRFVDERGKPGGEVRVQGHIRTDNTAVVVALAQQGAGIARIADLVAQPLVKAGALVPVLPAHFATTPVAMFAVMLKERHRLPKVRACIDHWVPWMAQFDARHARQGTAPQSRHSQLRE